MIPALDICLTVPITYSQAQRLSSEALTCLHIIGDTAVDSVPLKQAHRRTKPIYSMAPSDEENVTLPPPSGVNNEDAGEQRDPSSDVPEGGRLSSIDSNEEEDEDQDDDDDDDLDYRDEPEEDEGEFFFGGTFQRWPMVLQILTL